jgi:hypothetical protein
MKTHIVIAVIIVPGKVVTFRRKSLNHFARNFVSLFVNYSEINNN